MVREVEVKSPPARGAATLYKFKLSSIRGGQNAEKQFKGDDFLKEADFARRRVSFLYLNGEEFTFMDDEDYSQFTLNEADIGDAVGYLIDGLEGIKGASASARTKPALLTTGLEVQIPEYLETGEVIKVNTETGKYISRA